MGRISIVPVLFKPVWIVFGWQEKAFQAIYLVAEGENPFLIAKVRVGGKSLEGKMRAI